MTVTPEEIDALTSKLSDEQLAHVGAALVARAQDRVPLTEVQARDAIEAAPLTPRRTPTAGGRIVASTRLLAQRGYSSAQITPAMMTVAYEYLRAGGWIDPDYPGRRRDRHRSNRPGHPQGQERSTGEWGDDY